MPKIITHIAIMDRVIAKLESSSDPMDREIARVMSSNREAAILGAIGPDIFFWAPDYDFNQILLEVYSVYKFLKDLYDSTIGKVAAIVDEVGEAVEDVVEEVAPGAVQLIKTTLREIQETKSTLESISNAAMFIGLINRVNEIAMISELPLDEYALEQIRTLGGLLSLFNFARLGHYLYDIMKPPLQLGEAEDKWYWFDMLHYRYTTEFAYQLLRNATDEASLAYAYGYITHIAGDVVGHPYVNTIVRGPYRMHPQRHAATENFIDTWVFKEYYGGDITAELDRVLRLPSSLPTSIRQQLYNSFIATYGDKPHPRLINAGSGGFLTESDITETFDLFREAMDLLVNNKVIKPEPPFDDVWSAIETALEGFREPPSPPSGDLCFTLDCIAETFEYIGEMIAWTVETIFAAIDTIITVVASIPVASLLAILYVIQLALYEILMAVRHILVISGFVYPTNEEIDTEEGVALIIPPVEVGRYPALHDHDEAPTQIPENGTEKSETIYGPYDYSHTPRTFIEELPFDENSVRDLAKASDPETTFKLSYSGTLGNATDLSIWLIKNLVDGDPVARNANWNLDGDRGYAYRQWTSTNMPPSPGTNVGENYIL